MQSDGEGQVYRAFRENLSKQLIFKQQPFMGQTWVELQFLWGAARYTCFGSHRISFPPVLSNYITENQSHFITSVPFAPKSKSLGYEKVVSLCYSIGLQASNNLVSYQTKGRLSLYKRVYAWSTQASRLLPILACAFSVMSLIYAERLRDK